MAKWARTLGAVVQAVYGRHGGIWQAEPRRWPSRFAHHVGTHRGGGSLMRLRVVTLNVCNTEGEPERLAAINRELRRLDPDLVAFQEVVQTADVKFLDTLPDGLDLHATHQASSSTSKLARTAEDGRSGSLVEGRGMAGATGGGGWDGVA
ncbi:hypothetical protein [Mesorhizobium sp. LNJC405B00]|uniref:hypothetical protein n=1 Tax=Mesorhizobium sp. LNJC405B00 TaxID=1287281 RepID=UPI0018DBA075|nr:hypothetical protein [Mesorhizobium sp. LNJC405B00]